MYARANAVGEESRAVLVYLHGNAGNISHRLPIARRLLRAPVDVFLFDYRGYGLSGGINRRWALESANEAERGERLIESIKAYDTGYEFESKVVGGNVPREFWPAVDKGFRDSMEDGVLAGYPLIDVKVTLVDGAYHAVDSSAVAFELAARAAYRQSMIGSSKIGLALSTAFLNAIEPAILNAISLESTSW